MIATLRHTYQTMWTLPVLVMWLTAWMLATLAGPFGTFESMGLRPRVIFWGAVSAGSIVLGYLGFGLAIWHVGLKRHLRHAALGVVYSSFLICPYVWLLTQFSVSLGHGEDPGVWPLAYNTALCIATVAVLRVLLQELILRQTRPTERAVVAPVLWQRLPVEHRQPILRLSASDHVVQVVSEAGQTELRMRFKDAVNEMAGFDGFYTHRSHWVARGAIKAARRDGGRWLVELHNGDEIPVSRKYHAELEAAGLI